MVYTPPYKQNLLEMNCNNCNTKTLFNIATNTHYCPKCGATEKIQEYGAETPKKQEKKDCGCGRKKRKS